MEIFKFEKEEISNYIRYDMRLFEKVEEPLNYIFKTLEKNGHSLTLKSLDKKIDLNKVKQNEGKNYNWSVINYKNVSMLIRSYRQHLTIFTKTTKPCKYGKLFAEAGLLKNKHKNVFSAFTFHSDMEFFKDDEHDKMLDKLFENPFFDLNKCIKQMFKVIIERGSEWVTNSACLKVPEHVEVKLAFNGEQVYGIDSFIFCMEEIASLHCQLFAENTMFKKLADLKKRIGEDFNQQYKIKEVHNTLKDDYYHGVGLLLCDKKNKKETSFKDVYALSQWYYDEVFQEIKK